MRGLNNSQVMIFAPKGQITLANIDNFSYKLCKQISLSDCPFFLLDMSEVSFLDSSGLLVIVRAFRIAQQKGQHFVISGINEPVKIVFELVRLSEFIDIYENRLEFENSLFIAA